jgi:hypothetical protein
MVTSILFVTVFTNISRAAVPASLEQLPDVARIDVDP